MIDRAFEEFWSAGMVKTGKKAARKSFAAALKREKAKPAEFARRLVEDVKARIAGGQFGFDRLHPATYLNGNRWEDARPAAPPAGHAVDAAGNAVPVTSQRRDFSGVDYGEGTRDEDLPDFLREGLEDVGHG